MSERGWPAPLPFCTPPDLHFKVVMFLRMDFSFVRVFSSARVAEQL
jgi:hypothetical protein